MHAGGDGGDDGGADHDGVGDHAQRAADAAGSMVCLLGQVLGRITHLLQSPGQWPEAAGGRGGPRVSRAAPGVGEGVKLPIQSVHAVGIVQHGLLDGALNLQLQLAAVLDRQLLQDRLAPSMTLSFKRAGGAERAAAAWVLLPAA